MGRRAKFTADEVVGMLRGLAAETGARSVSRRAWDAANLGLTSDAVVYKFEGWHNALWAAGLQPAHIPDASGSGAAHRLVSVDHEARTGVCVVCGPTGVRVRVRDGAREASCRGAASQVRAKARHRIMRQRGTRCENPECTATIVHPGQLDVHHVDGDHENNEPSNLATLCANCHRGAHFGVVKLAA